MKVAIISHTNHFLDQSGNVVGFGPTVREINLLLEIFEAVYHIAPLHQQGVAPANAISYVSDKIIFVPLQPSGGHGLMDKIGVLGSAFSNLKVIQTTLKEVDVFQFRGPTGIGVYLLPYISFFSTTPRWVKYAGNWVQENPPAGYAFQRWWLKKNLQKSPVTVNGKWPAQEAHVLSFENPCITDQELQQAKSIAAKKSFKSGLVICMVGRIEKEKGVGRILEALKHLPEGFPIEKVYFVGDGPGKPGFVKEASSIAIPCVFTGTLDREALNDIYAESHIFCLPSTASEGFPKVIAEAAAFGCIPLVSSVSSIAQYIHHGVNGSVLEVTDASGVAAQLQMLEQDRGALEKLSANVVSLAEKFTYSHYNSRIINDVLPKLIF